MEPIQGIPMVYLTRKTTRGQHYYYLVKSFKYDGRVEKVQQYLGSDEPNESELEQLKQKYTIDLELAAIERMAIMSSETYRTPYLEKSALLGLERMRFLNRALHRLESPEERTQENMKNSVLNINGNMSLSSAPLSIDSVEAIFEQDRAPTGVPLSKVLEALSLRRLHDEIPDRIARLDKKSILRLHQDLFEGTGKGGLLRQDSASLPGSAFMPPPPFLIEDELEGLLQWWHDPSPLHPFERAILFHHRFQQVKPFESGNGLVGRLILDGMLVRFGLSTTRWQKEDRSIYLSGLVAGDRGDRTKLIEIFWKAYKKQHRPSVEGGKDSLRLSPRQSQLEAF